MVCPNLMLVGLVVKGLIRLVERLGLPANVLKKAFSLCTQGENIIQEQLFNVQQPLYQRMYSSL